MKRLSKNIILILLTILFMFLWFGCSDDDDVTNSNGDPSNQSPVIDSMTADPDTFIADIELTTVIVYAHDPDSGSLSYSWEAHSTGSWLTGISGAANVREFGNCCAISQLTAGEVVAIVSDGQGGETKDSITVWVTP